MKENEMDGTCDMHNTAFRSENLRGRGNLGDLGSKVGVKMDVVERRRINVDWIQLGSE
jgi:hypothetical protein